MTLYCPMLKIEKYHINQVLIAHGFPNTFGPDKPLRFDKDLGMTDGVFEGLDDKQLADLLELRLEQVGASPKQAALARNTLGSMFLEKYYNEEVEHFGSESFEEAPEDDFEGRTRYVSIEPSVASLANVRKATRQPDIIRGIAANKFAIMAAAPGTGKSMLGLKMCAAVASGESILGFTPNNEDGLNALFVSLEEDSDEILLRWQAINQVYDIDTAERLHIAGEDNVKFHSTGGIEEFIKGGIYDLVDLINDTQAKFVILDPLAQWRLGAEDNATFSLFSSAIKQICVSCECTVMVIHHVRKPPPGFQSESHNADSIRGASDLRGAARTILLLDYETKIAPGVISCSFDKVQYGESKFRLPPMKFSQEIIETDTGNYEVGVLVEYVPPHELPMPAHEVDEYRDALCALFETQEQYRADIRSGEWLGIALAAHMQTDIGAGRKTAERTNDQQKAITKLKNDIARLVRFEMVEPSEHVITIKSGNQRQIQIYRKGWKL